MDRSYLLCVFARVPVCVCVCVSKCVHTCGSYTFSYMFFRAELVSNLVAIGTSIFEVDTERCSQLILSNFCKSKRAKKR